MNKNEQKETAGQTTAPVDKSAKLVAMEEEMRELELKAKRLEIMEKEANLQDVTERLAERELKREQVRQRSVTNGQTLKQLAAIDKSNQSRCNHKKGGNGQAGIVGGQGDDSQYAVLKHTFGNGDMWVRCLRCGKTWKPPIEDDYATKEAYLKAFVEYETAVNFTTRNVPSGSVMFKFSDGGQSFRENMRHVTLR